MLALTPDPGRAFGESDGVALRIVLQAVVDGDSGDVRRVLHPGCHGDLVARDELPDLLAHSGCSFLTRRVLSGLALSTVSMMPTDDARRELRRTPH